MAPDWSWNDRVISMLRVLIDACGWVAVIEAGINIDHALLDCVGTKQLAIVPNVISELEALDDRKLLISMLQSKAEVVMAKEDVGSHTDDQLLALSKENNWPVLTVDTELKRRLSQSNLSWIEVSGRSHLRHVG
tara:strand:+ start:61 stop:462 length:402 start_codon:yes stop_codon:yes gene_type:complete